ITFKYKAAQRRFTDRLLWDRLQRESPVYDGDFIRTAESSEATITFNEGSMIDLEENSLIQIKTNPEGAVIDINEGVVNANVAVSAGLVLSSGNSRVTVDSGAVISAGVGEGEFLLQVMEGSASFSGDDGAGTVSAGQIFAPGEGILAAAAALSPPPAARFLNPNPGKLPIPFRWSRENLTPDTRVRFEIAEDRGFTRPVAREELAGDTITVDLDTGSYFWRISAMDSDGNPAPHSSNYFSLKVLAVLPPALISPATDYTYQFRVKKPAVQFQWEETAGAFSYRLEVADNPGMENPVFSQEVLGTSLYSSDLGAGLWYWQVQPVFPRNYIGDVGSGPPASFRIAQSGGLESPVLQSPADQGVLNVSASHGDVYFSWKSEPEALSYTIRFSEHRDLRDPVITGTVRNNFYVYPTGETGLTPGLYYWGVFQTDGEGNNSAFSPARALIALEGELIHRAVFPPDGYTIGSTLLPELSFIWKTNLSQQSRLQISARADFSRPVVNEAVNGETFRGLRLPEGTWYWRILTRGAAGNSFETPPKTFTVLAPLPAPVPEQPSVESRVVVQEGKPVVFSWKASPGADYYQFKLYHGENRSKPVYTNSLVEETRRLVSLEHYGEGNYYWTIQGFIHESNRNTHIPGLVGEGAFAARKVRAVTLQSPPDGAVFEGLAAYRQPETVRWSSAEALVSGRFILSRNRNFTGQPVTVLDDPPTAITLPPLTEGDYYWTIRAETTDGVDISAPPRLIRILPLPLLQQAANRTPPDGTVITGETLKQNRKLSFSWEAVPDATGYFFTILEGENQEILRVGPQTATAVTLEDLSVLHRGEFAWQVEAVMAEPGQDRQEHRGAILRRGEIGKNRFILEYAHPGPPELRKPGLLYGRRE
ncbi:MAG: FecR family protein, partial [Treponema sp.]|nr:FecR family protein [Treponema sp.]